MKKKYWIWFFLFVVSSIVLLVLNLSSLNSTASPTKIGMAVGRVIGIIVFIILFYALNSAFSRLEGKKERGEEITELRLTNKFVLTYFVIWLVVWGISFLFSYLMNFPPLAIKDKIAFALLIAILFVMPIQSLHIIYKMKKKVFFYLIRITLFTLFILILIWLGWFITNDALFRALSAFASLIFVLYLMGLMFYGAYFLYSHWLPYSLFKK